jgi:hypothetical protein
MNVKNLLLSAAVALVVVVAYDKAKSVKPAAGGMKFGN